MRYPSLILFAALLMPLSYSVRAQPVYKHTDRNGRVTYDSNPAAGNGSVERIEIAPHPSGVQPAPGLSPADQLLLEQANERAAKLDRATDDIVAAHRALRGAEERRAQGAEPLEGERAARRFRREYWERQQALNRDVETAKAALDDALARRDALR